MGKQLKKTNQMNYTKFAAALMLAANTNALPRLNQSDYPVIDEMLEPYDSISYEVHEVHTDDGYILHMFHLLNADLPDQDVAQPVLIGHGMMSNGAKWLDKESESDDVLPTAVGLAMHGDYDVWIANFRGTYYSYEHETLDWYDMDDGVIDENAEAEYWNFS